MIQKFRKYILASVMIGFVGTTISIIGTRYYSFQIPKQLDILTNIKLPQLDIFVKNSGLSNQDNQDNPNTLTNKYIRRTSLDSDLIHFIINNNYSNKYAVIFGSKGSGKTSSVNSIMSGYLSVFKFNIKKPQDLKSVLTNIANKLNPNTNKASNVKIEEIIELMKQFHKEKYYKPKLIFDFNFIDGATFDEIKQIVKKLIPYCQIMIILPSLPPNYIEDLDNEHLINLDTDKYVIDYWACVWITQLSNEKIILSEEQYNVLKEQNKLTPGQILKISNNMSKGMSFEQSIR